MQISFERGKEVQREPSTLPAELYNAFHTLLAHNERGYVFVPLRSMQYLAVIDMQEVIFSDSNGPRVIQVAWQNFRPQARSSLDGPVPYERVIYDDTCTDSARLQHEFFKMVNALLARQRQSHTRHSVTEFKRK